MRFFWLRLFLRISRAFERAPFYLFSAAAFPVLGLYSLNVDQLWPSVLVSPLLAAGANILVIWGLFALLLRSLRKGGLLAFCFLGACVVMRSFADLLVWILGKVLPDALAASLAGEGLALVVLGALLALAALRLAKSAAALAPFTWWLNVSSLLVLVFPLITIGVHAAKTRNHRAPATARPTAPGAADLPDIYYVVLDAYGRADVLKELYGHDNAPFLEALKARGFSVLERSRSNYQQTTPSIASTLNMDYLPGLMTQHAEWPGLITWQRLIAQNRLQRRLQAKGYKTVSILSGWSVTNHLPQSDVVLSSSNMDEFQRVLYRSFHFPLVSLGNYHSSHRQVILYNLEKLERVPAEVPGPKFVFAHLVCPHSPYVFDREGNEIPEPAKQEGFQVEWTQREKYLDQLVYLNGRVLKVVDEILAQSARPPVILLASDHGPASLGIAKPPTPGMVKERTSNLMALRVPCGDGAAPPADMTPVNLFRFVMDACLGEKMGLLPDRVYYSTYEAPTDYHDVTSPENPRAERG